MIQRYILMRGSRIFTEGRGGGLRIILFAGGGGGVQGLFSCNFTSEFKKLKFSSVDL